MHQVLAHAAEKIAMNDGFGLIALSESGLEGCHRSLRMTRDIGARKTSLTDNLWDVFKVLWIRTDPEIQSYRRVLTCRICKEQGHTIRSCPTLKANLGEITEDDRLVESFFLD